MRFLALGLLALPAAAQDTTSVWTQFGVLVHGDYRFGYKDAGGRPRLPARFGPFTSAQTFRHIMAVSDGESLRQYYLLRNGRAVGRDSVYMFDYQVDCEQEGFIRFTDRKQDRVGFLNAQGRTVIPAQYNQVSPFYNGLAVALVGARRHCWGGGNTLHCEHLGWTGGHEVLINQRNEVLADLATASRQRFRPNWYSLQRNAPAPDTATTVTLTASNGERYTFTDYDREFRQWFFGQFVPAVRSGRAAAVQALCFSELAVAARPFRGWVPSSRAAFVARYQAALRACLGPLRPGMPGLDLMAGDLNPLIFSGPAFHPFLTDCGEHFAAKYPVFEVLLTYPVRPANAPLDHQEHFEFIRTAGGYRLFSAAF